MKSMFFLILSAILMLGCSQGSGGGSSQNTTPTPVLQSPIEGTDLTGVYKLIFVACFDTNSNLTALASVDTSNSSIVLNIQGNTLKEVDTSPSCTINVNGRISLTQYTLKLSERNTTTSTNSACSMNLPLVASSGPNIAPNAIAYTTDHNSTISDETTTATFVKGQGILVYNPGLTVVGSPSDRCFMNFKAQ